MTETIGERLAAALVARGVRLAFGMPGGATIPLMAALEADAAWQLTGAPGVCVATLGPGVTNLVSGVAGAWLERSRLLAIGGQCEPGIEPIYTHQILDQVALFRTITRHAEALRAGTAGRRLAFALRHLDAGPPGPLYLELSAGTLRAPVEPAAHWNDPLPTGAASGLPATAALQRAADLLSAAQRPLLFVGHGDLSDAAAGALRALAEQHRIPVLTTYRAKGMLPEDHPLCLGAAGLSPVVDALQQERLAEADLVLAVGLDPVELRPNWLPGWPTTTPLISIDPHGQPDLLVPIAADLRGEVAASLGFLARAASAARWSEAALAAHRAALEALIVGADDGPAEAIRAVQRGLDGQDAVVCLDVGAHRITASHVWSCARPRRLLQSNGFSSMGVGLPMAIAARLCCPDRPAVALTGDMGLWMTEGELGTAAELGLDLVVVYLADDSLSLIEVKQERDEGRGGLGVRFRSPDPEALAAAYGGRGWRVRGAAAVEAAVRAAVAQGGLHLIEVRINPAEYRAQM